MHDWISFITVWTCVPLSTIAIFEGTRCLTQRRTSRGAVLILLVGTSYLLGSAGFLYWWHTQLSSAIGLLTISKPVPSLSREEFKGHSASDLTERTKLLASIKFTQTGVIGTYTDIAGRETKYAPTQNEIEDRVNMQSGVAEVRSKLVNLQTQIYYLVIACITALLSGLFAGVREAKESTK